MLARKVIAGGQQIKKINEHLRASKADEPQKSEDSFKYATEGEETVSSETEEVTSGPKITSKTISEVAENLENRFVFVGTMAGVETTESRKMGVWSEESAGEEESLREKGGSRSGEATERSVGLGKNVQEPIPSVEETLEDQLKRVSNSYNPKRKKSSGVKISSTARGELQGVRRSRVRLNWKKSLEESKRKVVVKRKKKVVKLVEAVEIEETDLVLYDEEVAEEVEVVTPKAKKIKTSKTKSHSKTKSAEPSTLAKRTRSAMKSKKVKIVEEEESEDEEETDQE
uniref:Uncharacterized protein n=1 Tax=Nicotiana tabacum TaxID=4097 RepID=A0A1S4DER8_TOBAC|nr:PREDICTED: uncharacterized protein LOC107828956 [Nicotiana tabacum]